jgi:hypothetical protein
MARSFNGTSDLARAVVHVYNGTRTAYSLACWVNGGTQQDKVFIIESRVASANGFVRMGSQNAVGGNKCRVVISGSTGTTLLDSTSTAVILDSTWHHVCFTLSSAGNWVLYVDGVADKSGGPLASDSTSANQIGLGAFVRNSNSQFYSGSLMDAANWKRQLAAGEVATLAVAPASHLGPFDYYPLWGSDSPEPDIGTGGTNTAATLTGTTAVNGALLPANLFAI